MSWVYHGTPGWYIGPSIDHYRCIQCYIPTTIIVRITDTLQYIPKELASPNTTTEDYFQQAIGYILSIIQEPLKTLPLLSYGYATKNIINHIVHILQLSTAHPRLKMLPLPPMLLQSHTQDTSPDIITHPDAPYMRVEQVVQPPRVKTTRTSPTSPPRVQHTPSPSSDPFINPWIKINYKKKIYPRLSQLHKIKLHHIKFNITYVSPHAMVVPIYALNHHITL